MGSVRIKPEYLAEKLLMIRENLKLSQEDLAAELSGEKVKLRKSDISRYENGMREPNLVVLLKYARLGRVNMEILVDDNLKLKDF